MTVVYKDRVKETSTTTGTGDMTLLGAVTGYQSFSGSGLTNGQQTHYFIENPGTSEWEVGLATFNSAVPSITRSSVLASSNANAAVNFSAGTKNVCIDIPASVVSLIQTAVQTSRQVAVGDGLTGGGDLSADRTLKINAALATIASAATTDLSSSTSTNITISGTTTITSFGTGANMLKHIEFQGALTLTHNATSLILPGAANITTAAGDTCIALSDGSGNWRVFDYTKASGRPLKVDGGDITSGTIATARLGSGTANSSTFLRGDQTYAAPPAGFTPTTWSNGSASTTATQNTTGSTLFIVAAVVVNGTGGATSGAFNVSPDNVTYYTMGGGSVAASASGTFYVAAIVPNGHYYKTTKTGAGSVSCTTVVLQ